jgi:ADP-ribosylglycohydrolase
LDYKLGLSSDIAREKIELNTGKKAIDFWSEPQENYDNESEEDPVLDFLENKWGVHGIYTDDTQYMLCNIQSILEVGKRTSMFGN